jgi:hypothetical protein
LAQAVSNGRALIVLKKCSLDQAVDPTIALETQMWFVSMKYKRSFFVVRADVGADDKVTVRQPALSKPWADVLAQFHEECSSQKCKLVVLYQEMRLGLSFTGSALAIQDAEPVLQITDSLPIKPRPPRRKVALPALSNAASPAAIENIEQEVQEDAVFELPDGEVVAVGDLSGECGLDDNLLAEHGDLVGGVDASKDAVLRKGSGTTS